MTNRIVIPAVAVVLVTGVVWGPGHGEGASAASAETVAVKRGDVAVTVGGIGHVATLTEAARLAVPAADTSSTSSAGNSGAPSDAVFSLVAGHVTAVLVGVGDKVRAGQPIANLTDNGETQTALIQARHDLAAARLDLAQKRVQDPTRGLPPTAAEMTQGQQALQAAQDNLARITGRPLPSVLDAARLELARAMAELDAEQSAERSRPSAMAAAELAVNSAQQRLALLTGAPDPTEVAAARLEVAKAQVELEALMRQPAPAAASEIAAADAAVAAARQRLTDAQAAGVAADVATAQADLARAQADRDALNQVPVAATPAAQAAAQLAVDAAQSRLNQVLHPPASAVVAARGELSKALADLAALRSTKSTARVAAARSAVASARSSLRQVLRPAPEVVSTSQAEVARAAADLAVLRQRGAPATETDLAIARLRVNLAEQQVRLAQQLIGRLTVRAPASGTVTSVLTTQGAGVDAATPLVRVQDLDHLVISVNLTEFDIGRTRVGAAARVSADALGGRPYAGSVADVAMSGSVTGGVVTFPVIVSVDDAEGLRPGMSVSVRVVVASREDVVVLPLDAVEDREGKQATVQVQTKSGDVKRRDVVLGLIGASSAEVVSGLDVGDRVVIPVDEEA